MSEAPPSVSAVVLAYGAEPLIVPCVEALLASEGVRVEVVLVDNGCTTDAVDRLEGRPGVCVVRPGHNTGFAGGCNLGASHASGDHLAFVNGDAVVTSTAVARLVSALEDPAVGLVSASVRLHDRPEVMNTAGNPVHYLGLSWAGGLGDPVSAHGCSATVASVSGAAMACTRERWQELGGFWEPMFAYLEDAELSLRCWLRGREVRYVADAAVTHRYEFSRNPRKTYLLERNRLVLLLTVYERRTLALLVPPLLGLEIAMLAVALRQGWAREKVRGWWWLLRHHREIAARRREVQGSRLRSDAVLADVLTGRFDPGPESGVPSFPALSAVASTYWSLVRRLLRR